MEICVATDPDAWNKIVDGSPYSVLRHKYEFYAYDQNVLPLIIRERNRCFLLPLETMKLFRGFKLVTSPVHYHASLLPDTKETIDLIPEALDEVINFLSGMKVDYLSTCAPTFLSKRYASLLNSWLEGHKASVQIMYAHMIPTGNTSFEEIWRHRFEKRTRNRIRKANKEGVGIIKIRTVDGIHAWIEDIFQCNVSALKRQGRVGAFPDSHKDVYLLELVSAKRLLKECFNIYGAIYHGRLIAYMVIQEYNKLMMVSKAMSHASFLVKYPNEALISHIVRDACEREFNWFQYGFDRVKRGGKIPSLYSSLQRFKFKFGFEDIPIFIYRLGLTHAGRVIQHLYNFREHVIVRSAYLPESVKGFLLRLYVPRRRKLFPFLHV